MSLYTCGLDISERKIYGAILENAGGHTVRQFCVPNSLESVTSELDAFLSLRADRQPRDLTVCAPNYGLDVEETLEPLWRKGFFKSCPPEGSTVDRFLLRAYRLERAYWDRAHLVAHLAQQLYCSPQTPYRFSLNWAWQNTLEKLHQLQLQRTRMNRPDWLREPTRCTISRLSPVRQTHDTQEDGF